MKHRAQFVLLLLIIAVGVSSATAQRQPPAESNTPKDSRITLSYQQAEDATIIGTERMLISGTSPDKLDLLVSSFFRGKTPTEKPVAVSFLISSGAKKELFAASTELILTLDGERLPLGSMRRGHRSCEKSLPSGAGCVYWVEKMDLFIPYRIFTQIINAKKVEGQVGAKMFSLKESQLKFLQDFNRQLLPQGVREF